MYKLYYNRLIKFRCDEKLYRKINEDKEREFPGGMDMSKYMRYRLKRDIPAAHPDVRKHLRELQYEINRIGNNINQIAKRMNTNIYLKEDKEQLFKMMEEVEERLFDIEKILYKEGV